MVIDDREGSNGLSMIYPLNELAVLSRLDCEGCQYHRERQAIGDVSMSGNGPDGLVSIGVEVKSISDFIQSELTGRLSDQLTALVNHYDVRWFLTYGRYQSGPFGKAQVMRGERWRYVSMGKQEMPFSYLEGMLLTSNVAGVNHKHVETEEQAAAWLAVLEHWWGKEWSEHKAFRKSLKSSVPGIIPDVQPDMLDRMRVAAQLPGVGWDKAMAAAVWFPSIRAMVNASEREWLEVPGIGAVIAKQIVRTVS